MKRLWEGKGDTGNDIASQRYVDSNFVYKAPMLPNLTEEQNNALVKNV
jgi:hypothetical protein